MKINYLNAGMCMFFPEFAWLPRDVDSMAIDLMNFTWYIFTYLDALDQYWKSYN